MSANVRHSSESAEHFTPAIFVNAAREALGGEIILDPATTCQANARTVRAKFCYTREENGFGRPWQGTVFLNPPGGKCDETGRAVYSKTKDHGPCAETGMCGLPPGHTHVGVESSQKVWWQKLVKEWQEDRVTAAVFVSFSIELLQTSQVSPRGLPTPHDFPIFFPNRRISYLHDDGSVGGSPPHSSMIVFVADSACHLGFFNAFRPLGGRFLRPG